MIAESHHLFIFLLYPLFLPDRTRFYSSSLILAASDSARQCVFLFLFLGLGASYGSIEPDVKVGSFVRGRIHGVPNPKFFLIARVIMIGVDRGRE